MVFYEDFLFLIRYTPILVLSIEKVSLYIYIQKIVVTCVFLIAMQA